MPWGLPGWWRWRSSLQHWKFPKSMHSSQNVFSLSFLFVFLLIPKNIYHSCHD
jgi:hypothetical protein